MKKKITAVVIFLTAALLLPVCADNYIGLTDAGTVEIFNDTGELISTAILEAPVAAAGSASPISMAYGDLLPSNEGNELAVLTGSGRVAYYPDPLASGGKLPLLQEGLQETGGRLLSAIAVVQGNGTLAAVSAGDAPSGYLYAGGALTVKSLLKITGAKHAPYISLTTAGGANPEWALLGADGYVEAFSGKDGDVKRQAFFKPGAGAVEVSRTASDRFAVLYNDNRVNFRHLNGANAGGDIRLKSTHTLIGFAVVAVSANPSVSASLATPAKEVKSVSIAKYQDVDTIWIDAVAFQSFGGWLLDTQFVHLMGSPYLIAAGIGSPVKDAQAKFDVFEPGNYQVWVRSRNWVKKYSPGKFSIQIDGNNLKSVFGAADSDEWVWEPAEKIWLEPGQHAVSLKDLTGYYGRCAALLVSKDPAYIPPKDLDGFRNERARLTGVSLAPVDCGEFDVVVVGGGASGVPAALAAARNGARTVLIQNRPVLGGNASAELGVPVNGASRDQAYARESGICEELGRVKTYNRYPKMTKAFEHAAQDEPNLTVFTNRNVYHAVMDGTRIVAVEALDTLTGAVSLFRGRVFVDTTGDGWLGYYAGADFRVGREARSEFNESLAPETADNNTMSGCLMGQYRLGYGWENRSEPSIYTPPEWAYQLPPNPEFGRSVANLNGQWWLEYPNHVDDVWNAEFARDELIRIVFGYWDFLKNKWEKRETAKNAMLSYVPITEAKRESRRLMGDYVLNQNDVLSARTFPDVIGHAGWSLDIHHPEGILSGQKGQFDFDQTVPQNNIPFRSLYSRNIENLLFAGRCMSVTHIALGTVRIEATCMVTGQAAGTAAALCAAREVSPRTLGSQYIEELQQALLRDDQYVPGIRNTDSKDLARSTVVSASSTAQCDLMNESFLQSDDRRNSLALTDTRWIIYETGSAGRIGRLFMHVNSTSKKALSLPVKIRAVQDNMTTDMVGCPILSEVIAVVPAGHDGYVEFNVQCDVPTPFFAIEAGRSPGLAISATQKGHLGSRTVLRRRSGQELSNVGKPRVMVYTDPPLQYPRNYAADNVINGVSRVVDCQPNMWKSDPQAAFPQWLQLKWDSPKRFRSVQLAFDTNLDAEQRAVLSVPLEVVQDYEVQAYVSDGWKTLVSEKGNFQRFRIHTFASVESDRLRILIHKTGGDSAASIYEMRVY
ncbi:MAG: FAD-dependent oxidoreductase [Kiritimatiellales bacterium]